MEQETKEQLKEEWLNLQHVEHIVKKKFCGHIWINGEISCDWDKNLNCSLSIDDWDFWCYGNYNSRDVITQECLRQSYDNEKLMKEVDRILLKNKKCKKMEKEINLFFDKIKKEAKKDKIKDSELINYFKKVFK